MAIWQFNIYFIPKQSLLELFEQIPAMLEYEEALTISWWSSLEINSNTILPLLQQFGDLQKWTFKTEGMKRFGNAESNDISISYDIKTDKIEELSCRIDLRQIDNSILEKVCSIASQIDCLLMDVKGRLFKPTLEELVKSIKGSNANSFVLGPGRFLDDLSKGIISSE